MRAAVVKVFGPPENIRFEGRYPVPRLDSDGKALIRVKAAGVNPVDTYIRSGKYAALPSLPYIPGREGAGIVEKISGSNVRIKEGDRVWFTMPLTGPCAEFALAPTDFIFPLPANVSFEQGATLGIAYLTAYRALFTKACAQSGESLFIHGVSGGVGLAVAQLAKAHGLTIYGSASTEHGSELAKSVGVEAVYNHKEKNYVEKIMKDHPSGFNIIIEMLANENLASDLALIAKQGRIVIVGSRGSIEFEPRAVMQKEAAVIGVMQACSSVKEYQEMAEHINGLLTKGLLSPLVGKSYPLNKVGEAHEDVMKNKGASGKLVIDLANLPEAPAGGDYETESSQSDFTRE